MAVNTKNSAILLNELLKPTKALVDLPSYLHKLIPQLSNIDRELRNAIIRKSEKI